MEPAAERTLQPVRAVRLPGPRNAGVGADQHRARSQRFVETTERSEPLKARARAIRDELADVVAAALADDVGRDPTDPDAQLAAGLLSATWTVALTRAHRSFRQTRDADTASAAFLATVDRGTVGLTAALAGTPYA